MEMSCKSRIDHLFSRTLTLRTYPTSSSTRKQKKEERGSQVTKAIELVYIKVNQQVKNEKEVRNATQRCDVKERL